MVYSFARIGAALAMRVEEPVPPQPQSFVAEVDAPLEQQSSTMLIQSP